PHYELHNARWLHNPTRRTHHRLALPGPRDFQHPPGIPHGGDWLGRVLGQHLAFPLRRLRFRRRRLPHPLPDRSADRGCTAAVVLLQHRPPFPRLRTAGLPPHGSPRGAHRLAAGGRSLLHHHLLRRHHRLGRPLRLEVALPELGHGHRVLLLQRLPAAGRRVHPLG